MAATSHPDPLQPYLDRVFALKKGWGRIPDAADVAAIVRELGLTAADRAAIDAEAGAAHDRGRALLAEGRFGAAVAELSRAAALRPTDAAILGDHAEAHLGLWRAEGQTEDRVAAALLARRARELDPGWARGAAIYAELETPPRVTGVATRIAAWLLMAAALGGGIWLAASHNRPPGM
jgi:hypothetical protein